MFHRLLRSREHSFKPEGDITLAGEPRILRWPLSGERSPGRSRPCLEEQLLRCYLWVNSGDEPAACTEELLLVGAQ